jgi:hypothetical protein
MTEFKIYSEHHFQRYLRFINFLKTKVRVNGEYTEKHHITPKSMMGSNESDNLVKLTPREHYIAHLMLWKSFRNKQTAYAFNCMNTATKTKKGKITRYSNSKVYEKFLIESREKMMGENAPAFGMVRSVESIRRQSEKMLGRKQSASHIRNKTLSIMNNPSRGKWNLGKKRSIETRNNIRESLTGKVKSETHKEKMKFRPQNDLCVSCPHCPVKGEFKNMKRWHFDFCKQNLNRLTKETKFVTCSNCGKTANQNPNFYKNHNSHCRISIP